MPQLFEVVDQDGATWVLPHRTCGGNNMFPAANVDTARQPAWWWYCESCKRFVRPLTREESSIMDQVIRSTTEVKTAGKSRKRG